MLVRPEAGSYMANIAAAGKLFNLRLEDREGRAENSSMWLRQQGSKLLSLDVLQSWLKHPLCQTSCRSPVIADDPHWSAIHDNKSTFN